MTENFDFFWGCIGLTLALIGLSAWPEHQRRADEASALG